MKLIQRFWSAVTYALEFSTINPFAQNGISQKPLFSLNTDVQLKNPSSYPHHHHKFKPPGGRLKGPGSDFLCDYSNMGPDWGSCTSPTDRGCWLQNKRTGEKFDIQTNYEDVAPRGVLRRYQIYTTDDRWNADGLDFGEAKLVNGSYPGPWLQACWGDVVEVTVTNRMKFNGTSIHWHGIRQNQTMHMDGVPGITQCPIAPGDSFTYKWNVTQYGSSWYHSHYSLQYADGLAGPMTLHGPTSADFDEPAAIPLILTDWGHNSAFDAAYNGVKHPDILLNGRGNITRFSGLAATDPIPSPFTLHFEPQAQKPRFGKRLPAKKYLLRLINTSWDTTFVFSIDNHILTITGADFVPIHPYKNTSVLIGIGQRYQLIVEALPVVNDKGAAPPSDGNFWIRTYIVPDCFGGSKQGIVGYEQTGILRYNNTSTSLPTSSNWTDVSLACSDENYESLNPVVPWSVGEAANGAHNEGEERGVLGNFNGAPSPYPLSFFSWAKPGENPAFIPLRINYSDPIFLNLNHTGPWDPLWGVVPENYSSTDWVYLVLSGMGINGSTTDAHPIHLHGHDFAILAQHAHTEYSPSLPLNLSNPPRRDVVLLPTDGYVVIAFKTDNPGSWLLHCHIAEHASAGLAFQIMERQKAANEIWSPFNESPAIQEAERVCGRWDRWAVDCENWWDGGSGASGGCQRNRTGFPFALQDDSGI